MFRVNTKNMKNEIVNKCNKVVDLLLKTIENKCKKETDEILAK